MTCSTKGWRGAETDIYFQRLRTLRSGRRSESGTHLSPCSHRKAISSKRPASCEGSGPCYPTILSVPRTFILWLWFIVPVCPLATALVFPPRGLTPSMTRGERSARGCTRLPLRTAWPLSGGRCTDRRLQAQRSDRQLSSQEERGVLCLSRQQAHIRSVDKKHIKLHTLCLGREDAATMKEYVRPARVPACVGFSP